MKVQRYAIHQIQRKHRVHRPHAGRLLPQDCGDGELMQHLLGDGSSARLPAFPVRLHHVLASDEVAHDTNARRPELQKHRPTREGRATLRHGIHRTGHDAVKTARAKVQSVQH